MLVDAITAGLNPEQRRAVETLRGPVCVLAGAGSGKTTTITRRIAAQIASGAFRPDEILAVTFTDKAAAEMRGRLDSLGAGGVRARTFHSAAAAQLRHLAAEAPGQILPSKIPALAEMARSLPKPYRFRPVADLATEIEWAKNRRVTLERYVDSVSQRRLPIPADLMVKVWRDYERGKSMRGLVDFEDLLELAIRMFSDDDYARERFQERYRAFTIDEYQDVNLLQHTLLERWLGDRDDLCVVGDDYQSIYSFTGASAEPLLRMPAAWPRTTVVKLETNYRSTPEVLDVANRVARRLGGRDKVLRPIVGSGPPVEIRSFDSSSAETGAIVERICALHHRDGVPLGEIAVLYRVNHRSEDYEEALGTEGIPFLVRDGGFLERPAARRMLSRFSRSSGTDVEARVRAVAEREGWTEDVPDGVGERELTRQRDMGRLVQLAAEWDDGTLTLAGFASAVRERFGGRGDGSGVQLLTLHRAKGLEFDCVFLPRLQEGELPFKRALGDDAVAEERRLFYVGITRARRHLMISWTDEPGRRPSRFLDDLRPRGDNRASHGDAPAPPADPAVAALRAWRLSRARRDGVPAYVVMHDTTLSAIASRRPQNRGALRAVPGIGPKRVELYGREILAALSRVEKEGSEA